MSRFQSQITRKARPRTIQEIVDEINAEWDGQPPRAAELLDALSVCESVSENIYGVPARELCTELHQLLKAWHGETGRLLRNELARKLNGSDAL